MSSTAQQLGPVKLFTVDVHTVNVWMQNDMQAEPLEPYQVVESVKIKGVNLEVTHSFEDHHDRRRSYDKYDLQQAVRLVQQLRKMLD